MVKAAGKEMLENDTTQINEERKAKMKYKNGKSWTVLQDGETVNNAEYSDVK